MPSASVTANPKIRLPNWPCAADGLRSAAARYWPKIAPTPTPAPPMPMQAMPAPMYFAATGSMWKLLFEVGSGSVSRVNRIVEIDASENGENVGLQERDQQLECGECDHHAEGQHATDCTNDAEARSEQRNEAGKDLQRDVAGQHVREKTHAMRDRAQQEGEHFDEHDQRQDVDRDAGRHEQLEEFQSVLPEAVDHDGQEDEQRETDGNNDVAGDRERIRDQSDHVRHQD